MSCGLLSSSFKTPLTDGSEDAEDVDYHNSSDIEDTTIDAQESPATKRSTKGRGKKGNFWEDPKDTERFLDLLEQFAMREHWVNTKKGGWRNKTLGEIGKHMGKDSKYCSHKYMRLKYKYLEVVELLGLRVGLKWDAESHKVSGHHMAWSEVKEPKLKKVKDRTFLYKEEVDNLNSLKFAQSLQVDKPREATLVVRVSSEAQESDAESSSIAVEADEDDEDDYGENEIAEVGEAEAFNGGEEDARSDDETHEALEAGPSPVTLANVATAETSSTIKDAPSRIASTAQASISLCVSWSSTLKMTITSAQLRAPGETASLGRLQQK